MRLAKVAFEPVSPLVRERCPSPCECGPRSVMKRLRLLLIGVCGLCFLSACGGGGGSSASPSPPPMATHLAVTAPVNAIADSAFDFTVTALDASNNTVTTYSGIVHFTSTDAQAVLPSNSTLTNGTKSFSATLRTTGSMTISATDTVTASITGVSSAIKVSAAMAAGTFTATGSMMDAREEHAATLLIDGRVLVTGGSNSTGTLATAEICDPASATFTLTGNMTTARSQHTATLLSGGKVLVVGGADASGNALAAAETFDPVSGTFTPIANLGTTRLGHTATLLNDGRVLIAGGENTTGNLATAELFDPGTGLFTSAAGNMTASRVFHTATLLSRGKVLIAGGTDSANVNGSALGDLFDPATATFTPTAGGGTTAIHLAAALLQDGRVLLTGGEDNGSSCGLCGNFVSSGLAILFSSSSASFAAAGDMTTARLNHTATLLSGGQVLIAGGATISVTCNRGCPFKTFINPEATAELFMPSQGIFTLTGNMTTTRSEHTATLLGNGKVLLVGGVDANGNALATAELFQ